MIGRPTATPGRSRAQQMLWSESRSSRSRIRENSDSNSCGLRGAWFLNSHEFSDMLSAPCATPLVAGFVRIRKKLRIARELVMPRPVTGPYCPFFFFAGFSQNVASSGNGPAKGGVSKKRPSSIMRGSPVRFSSAKSCCSKADFTSA